jgi:beta-1,2-mannobiose phosphorylase / 1,2-beta-oligomannan phosphorylase
MFTCTRSPSNPLISPVKDRPWEAMAAFNWCPVKRFGKTHVLYRAMTLPEPLSKEKLSVSSIAHAVSYDGVYFTGHKQLIVPEHDWEQYGCEDPRITKLNGTYYIFYTALATFPFGSDGIKVAMATTRNLKHIDAKHLITPFNAKAMALFPERVNGKMAALLSVNTDMPPASIGYIEFDTDEDLLSHEYWQKWYKKLEQHTIDPRRSTEDHVEVGAPPIKTEEGWLLIYSHIQNYFQEDKVFGIEALLLDSTNPRNIIGRTSFPILVPEELYEKYGHIPNIVFPSGALLRRNRWLDIYYGAADTTCCTATLDVQDLLKSMKPKAALQFAPRFADNPIVSPRPEHEWEAKATFNPAAIDLGGRVHLLYRAMSSDDASTVGYASSEDGLHFDERLDEPVYVPREPFEQKAAPGNSGCEDARLVLFGDTIYMTYTAFNAKDQPRVAVSSISEEDFLAKRWNWSTPRLISPHGIMDKNACLFPEMIDDRYMLLHRVGVDICADFVDSLDFVQEKLQKCIVVMQPRRGMWDSKKIGISAPPIKTRSGWLLLYHGIGEDNAYRVGAALLDSENPAVVLARTNSPLLEPEYEYEKVGQVPNVVFPCGIVLRDDTLFVYYGGADSYTAVATMSFHDVMDILTRQ